MKIIEPCFPDGLGGQLMQVQSLSPILIHNIAPVHTGHMKKVGLIFALLLGVPLIGTLFVDVDPSPTPDDIELEASVRARARLPVHPHRPRRS